MIGKIYATFFRFLATRFFFYQETVFKNYPKNSNNLEVIFLGKNQMGHFSIIFNHCVSRYDFLSSL